MGNGAASMTFITSIADIGWSVKLDIAFFRKVFTVLVARVTGSIFDITENDLSVDIFWGNESGVCKSF